MKERIVSLILVACLLLATPVSVVASSFDNEGYRTYENAHYATVYVDVDLSQFFETFYNPAFEGVVSPRSTATHRVTAPVSVSNGRITGTVTFTTTVATLSGVVVSISNISFGNVWTIDTRFYNGVYRPEVQTTSFAGLNVTLGISVDALIISGENRSWVRRVGAASANSPRW
jgi:hypothetical protein